MNVNDKIKNAFEKKTAASKALQQARRDVEKAKTMIKEAEASIVKTIKATGHKNDAIIYQGKIYTIGVDTDQLYVQDLQTNVVVIGNDDVVVTLKPESEKQQ